MFKDKKKRPLKVVKSHIVQTYRINVDKNERTNWYLLYMILLIVPVAWKAESFAKGGEVRATFNVHFLPFTEGLATDSNLVHPAQTDARIRQFFSRITQFYFKNQDKIWVP